jgi:hypothetical protein
MHFLVIIIIFAFILLLASFALVLKLAVERNIQNWFPAYIKWRLKSRDAANSSPVDIYFCVADHFEPFWNGADRAIALQRVRRWCHDYASIAANRKDSVGQRPRHTMFYPIEEYDEEILDILKRFCQDGFGDVEIHLHHDRDNESNLRRELQDFSELLYRKHQLLRYDPALKKIVYGFVHGNWALNNSRRDGRWCGVDSELRVLRETGCYADFTMPSAPDQTQPSVVNSIYFLNETKRGRHSLDSIASLAPGAWRDDRLLSIQGPLVINWRTRLAGILPTIETGELSADNPPSHHRMDLWHAAHIHVLGRPDHIFIKTHTHSLQEATTDLLLGPEGLRSIWDYMETRYNDLQQFRLHYVTAHQLYEKIRLLSHQQSNLSVKNIA